MTTATFPIAFSPRATQSLGIKAYTYCVVDLETRNCAADVIARVVEKKMADWNPPANYKDPIKIAALREEVRATAGDKSACWDEAPIATIGLKSDTEFRLLHTLRVEAPRLVSGATVQGFDTEADMLKAFRALVNVAWVLPDAPANSLDPMSPTQIVGHNIAGFDLPKLRLRSIANKLQLPRGLIADLPVYDTMRRWGRFSRDQSPFVPLADVVDALGIPAHKHIMSGAQVPESIAAGRFDEVIDYALLDLLAEEQAFLMMTGQHPSFS
jgi:hypothetical protein